MTTTTLPLACTPDSPTCPTWCREAIHDDDPTIYMHTSTAEFYATQDTEYGFGVEVCRCDDLTTGTVAPTTVDVAIQPADGFPPTFIYAMSPDQAEAFALALLRSAWTARESR